MHVLRNEALEVSVDTGTFEATIVHRATGRRWAFRRNPLADLRVVHGSTDALAYLADSRECEPLRYRTLREDRLTCLLKGLPGGVGLSLTYALPYDGDALRIELEPIYSAAASRIAEAWYPGPLEPLDEEVAYTVWPNAGGMILPARHDQEIVADMSEYETQVKGLPYAIAYSWHLYQPWWGAIAGKTGYVAIAETPYDFALELRHPAGGPTTTRPVWVPSFGRLAYKRAIRYRFLSPASYVTLAKAYRAYAQEIGRWVSLQEKIARNPVVERLIGSIIFPVSICRHNLQVRPPQHAVTTFEERARQARRLRQLGVERAYLHIDGWGYRGYDNQHPGIFPPCPEAGGWDGLLALSETARECGYLLGLHDQFRDYHLDGPAFSEAHAVKLADGTLPLWSRWAGGSQSLLCAQEALPFIRQAFSELLGHGIQLGASYLDVFAMNPLDECYDPRHPTTREACYRWRAEAMDFVRELGLAISSEEPADCFIPHLDFAHWNGYPRRPTTTGEYLGIPVPLHNLVYHDALLLPALYAYRRTALSARDFLEGLAQVEIPYGNVAWERPEDLVGANQMAALHRAWAMHELVDHRLLDETGMVQEYEYPEGAVAIDLTALRYRIERAVGHGRLGQRRRVRSKGDTGHCVARASLDAVYIRFLIFIFLSTDTVWMHTSGLTCTCDDGMLCAILSIGGHSHDAPTDSVRSAFGLAHSNRWVERKDTHVEDHPS
ncbi:MAG: hypothetical protein FJZ90_01465 [Chloroflexi bacterium]|nr:hypothetical protein [Chloroflexota bacterium]